VSLQAVQQRRARLQSKVPMASDIATYVVAQREGVPLHKYLDAETLDQIAAAEQRVSAKEAAMAPVPSPGQRARKAATITVKEVHLGKVKVPESALSPRQLGEAEKMAAVYPIFYAFENSVREFVDGHLTEAFGKGWWSDSKIVSRGIRDTVKRNQAAEGKHRYHSRRGAREIYYTNLGDLTTITVSEKGLKVFKKLFPSDKWLGALVEKIEASRNVVAHMNPLQKRDIDRIRLNFEDWLEQIKGREPPSIPS